MAGACHRFLMRHLFQFEHRRERLAPDAIFQKRLLRNGMWSAAIIAIALAVGIVGYMGLEGMRLVDAFVNAAMILSGMGPMGELKHDSAKIFAGSYALVSGLLIFAVAGVALVPVFHRMMHRFHLQDDEQPPKKKGK
jgi:hypothetical protein